MHVGIPSKIVKSNGGHVVIWSGYFCNFRCALAFANKYSNDVSGMDSVRVHQLYQLLCTDELYEAPDWRLLCTNGGSMDESTFDGTNHRYMRLNTDDGVYVGIFVGRTSFMEV
jgi:hypothetical protein